MKILIIISVISFPVFTQSENEYVRRGDEAYKNFDLINAVKNYEAAYNEDSNNYFLLEKVTKIYNDLSENYFEINDEKNAELAVNKAVRYAEIFYSRFPDSAKVFALLAMSYGNLATYKGGNDKIKLANKIRQNAEKSIKLYPNDYLPYIVLSIYNRQIASLNWFERAFANTFFGKVPEGSLESAEELMIKALKIQPGIIIAMFHLSLVYKEMVNEQKEIECLQKIMNSPISDFRDKYAIRKAKESLMELLD
jgi:tetratricopeptide (TPR) repeat protein